MRYLVPALLAFSLTACVQPYGPRDPYGDYGGYYPYDPPPPGSQYPQGRYEPSRDPYGYDPYRAVGTEPFWSLTITPEEMRFESPDGRPVVESTPRKSEGYSGPSYRGRRIAVNILRRECSDGMSDRRYPDEVQVYVDGRQYRGCGAPARFFDGQWDEGYGSYTDTSRGYEQVSFPLERTNWRVTRVNGLAVPSGGYYMNFLPGGQVNAKFGCNEMNGSYRQYGETLDLQGGLQMTRMACPDMSFESRASNILSRPLRVAMDGDRVTFSNDLGRIEAVRAR
ncbi:META domain-containing protein [Sphingomicrobium aestuariivivum]|uniref:META domain-containing protein n=1 Tax=Sphingomicrobium aestuariivivum TaxID=1582356 RepID=UPI001FD71B1F|nr:META domain-containing protein [Sphingomicrobium aestuariivivum]MCJ8190058.1 META domain-containing protein [Sphingomicrobium aestuariivivum]